MAKLVLGLFVAALFGNAAAGGKSKLPWGYDGLVAPKNWGKHFKMCAGDTQSGIDIITDRTVRDPEQCRAIRPEDWTLLGSKHASFRVKYYGSSVSFAPVSLDSKTKQWTFSNLRQNAIGRLANQFGRYKDVHRLFCFQSFHFHWGSADEGGSEHNINGVRYPLEVHFVHYSCDYPDIKAALSDPQPRDKYVLAVVGVLFELGHRANRGFEDILTAKRSLGNSTNEFIIRNLLLRDLIPRTSTLDYYAYEGSLTTPPCNPVVRWHVLKQPVVISPEQLRRFKQMAGSVKLNIQKNYRPVQRNRNDVFYCSNPLAVQTQPKTPLATSKTARPDVENVRKSGNSSAGSRPSAGSLLLGLLMLASLLVVV